MEQADQTLHDFVLNLLGDSQALAAFEQDPAAVLDHAGLSDISAADVQEVIPLVVDFVPAHADMLDSIMSQLPLDSVTGQLGAIQQLQFVTQALGGGLPPFHSGGSLDVQGVHDEWNLGSDGDGHMWAETKMSGPLGGGTASMGGDLQHGMAGGVSMSAMGADLHAGLKLPGLGGLPGLGDLGGLGGLAGAPSGFSAMSDVTNTLDSHLGSVTSMLSENATNTANLVSGVAEFATGAVANPAALTDALANPAATLNALTGTVESFGESGASTLPAPAGAAAGEAMTTINSATQGVVSEVTSHLPGVGDLGSHLPLDPTQALDTVQGVVGNVTSQLPTGALGSLPGVGDLSHVTSSLDPSHALGTVANTLSGVTGEVSSVTSHSPVGDVLGGGGAGDLLGSLDHATDVTGDLSHLTNDLHLPGL
jgi:hypothetical protein